MGELNSALTSVIADGSLREVWNTWMPTLDFPLEQPVGTTTGSRGMTGPLKGGVGTTGHRPLIGVPGMWSAKVQGMRFAGAAVAAAVLRSIDRAGGEPVVLFPGSSESAAEQLSRLDGVVIPGGADIDPRRYGSEPDEHYWPADHPGQDEYEAALLRACLDSEIPMLAICRGMQLLNVIHGGTLLGHLAPGAVEHRGAEHPVTCEPGTPAGHGAGGCPGAHLVVPTTKR